ncbi:MAG: DNA gyrase subunit B, partial [Acidobacteria bacterium]|nr:DNA gyrase subunit B [Acidobacteriota bacterium]
AQPPLYRIKKGKSEQYIKDDREFVRVMVKRAAEGMVVRYGEGAARLEGAPLTKFMTTLNEYLNFFDKVDKRLRNERVTDSLPRLGLAMRSDFEGDKNSPPKKLEKLEKQLKSMAKEEGFKSVELRFEEEHSLWEAHFADAQGAPRVVNWRLVSTPEYRQMVSKYRQIEPYMEPPFVVQSVGRGAAGNGDEPEGAAAGEAASETSPGNEKAAKKSAKAARRPKAADEEPVEKTSARDLFDHVLNEGRKDYSVQRYKGLGEMSSHQLWETTMDPERRTLLEVKLEDIAECETIFSTLMGEDVEARRKFIEENALDVKNLDI